MEPRRLREVDGASFKRTSARRTILDSPIKPARHGEFEARHICAKISVSGHPARSSRAREGRKSKQAAAPGATAPKPNGKPGGDRQFGELEGWSPGKEPPKAEKKDDTPAAAKGAVGITPSGNMSVGLPF